jgi:hypothetical protein
LESANHCTWVGYTTPDSKMTENNSPETKKRANRLPWKIAVAGLLLLCIVVFVHGIHLVNPKHVEMTIAQGVPLGADQNAVLRFLDAQRIPHSGYYPEFRRIYAGIDRSSIGMMKGHINIEFNFDAQGKLVSYKVRELFDFL